MNYSFTHCLRIQIVPSHFEDERIKDILNYCLKYGFQNVMLFINSEEYNHGHMTIEEAKPWVETIKKAKAIFNLNGISVSLNPWIELGHLNRSRPLKSNQHFTTMVDYDGTDEGFVACPLCEEWRSYFAEYYTYLIKEIEPDTIWVEDDFRLHNHGELKFGGCFCKLHMQKYNEKLGTNYIREEFTDLLFRKEHNEKVKKAWLDVSRETMVDLASFIGKIVKNVGLNTKVGLMSSMPQMHAMEARDWKAIHESLAQGGPMINRLHLPCYIETTGKSYYFAFNQVPFVVRSMIPNSTLIYPELENAAFSTYSKDSRFLKFQLESAIPLCIKGMTYDIYDFVGNGPNNNFKYGEAVSSISPYLDTVTNLNLDFSSLEGVLLPVDQDTVYNRKDINDFSDFYPDEWRFYSYLTSFGINCKTTTEKSFKNCIVALSNNSVNNFTNDELIDLFKNNKIILEGGALKRLIDRNLSYLIGALSYNFMEAKTNSQSYEEINKNNLVNGIKGYRASTLSKAGDFLNISYSNDDLETLSNVYDYNDKLIGKGVVCNNNIFIIPYIINSDILYEQFNPLRTTLIYNWLLRNDQNKLVLTNYNGVYSYLYNNGSNYVLILINSTVESFQQIDLAIKNINISNITYIDKVDGQIKPVEFLLDNNKLTLELGFEFLSTHTLLIETK